MNFLAPAFLAGLAALAIPVLIHLINRERKEVIEFPSLMFLQKIPYKSVRRQKLRHLLLLALRCLAIFIVVFAFSRPFLERRNARTVAAGGAREVVVLLDRSYSMGYGDRWSRAQDAVRSAAGSLGPTDRMSLVLFAHDAGLATEPTADRARIDRALRSAELTSEDTRFGPALKLGERILRASNLPRKELVLVSDFQKVGWARREEVSLPVGAKMNVVDLGIGESADVAVSRVTTDLEGGSDRPQATVAARLTNTGKQARTLQATLELNGRAVQTKSVTVPASGAAQVRFATVAVSLGDSRGVVRVDHDALPQNDAFHFVISPSQALGVLLLQPGSPRENEALYLNRALGLGDRPRFRVDAKSVAQATPRDLDNRSLVVLSDVPLPGGAFGDRLREFVRDGGGLLFAPGTEQGTTVPTEWRDIVPVQVGDVVDRTGVAGGTLASTDYSHPIFELFDAPRSGDFSTARFYRYRRLTTRGDSGVLARFDDGAPALVERNVGAGRVLIWASTLDSYWTDLPLQAVWVPFVHQIGKHAGRYADARSWYTAGDVLDLSRHAELTAGLPKAAQGGQPQLVVETPSNRVVRLAGADSSRGAQTAVPLVERGFYELRVAGATKGTGRMVAVNVDPNESDLSRLDPQELVASVTSASGRAGSGDGLAMMTESREERERRQTIWWYLLAGALVLLAVETVVSNRLSRVSA